MTFNEYFLSVIEGSNDAQATLLDVAQNPLSSIAVSFKEVEGCVVNETPLTFSGNGIAYYLSITSATSTPNQFLLHKFQIPTNLALGNMVFGVGEIRICFDACKQTYQKC